MLHLLMNHSAETGLLMFVVCFAAIGIFAATRSHGQLDDWSRIPLGSNSSDDATEKEAK